MTPNIQIPKAFRELFEPKRFKVFYGGRGGAKSHNFARALLVMGAQKSMRILCAREYQSSINDSVHKLLSDIIYEYGLESFYEVQKATIIGANGTEFIFKGLKHNPTEIKSTEGVDVCWVEEAERVSDNSWELLIPTIRKDNSEIWISFNPKNPNDPTYERFIVNADDDTLLRKVSWEDNPFFPEVLNQERLKLKKIDPEAYDHVWEGNFDIRKNGAVYAKQLDVARTEGRITAVPYDPSCEVFTAWDLGFGDATAIWWLQFVGRELRWLDYYENSGEQLNHYVQIVKSKPYNYSRHFLPHDGGHGNIRGDSVSNQLHNMGLPNTVLERDRDIMPAIEVLRKTIAYSVFDENKCKEGLKALSAYAYEWDEDRAVFKRKPRHDWTSHAADAARYAAKAASNLKTNIGKVKPIPSMRVNKSWMSV